jgi:hypothetical protein
MSGFLSEKELAELVPSELCPHSTPIPTQIVSSDEYYPDPQSEKQREVEQRLLAMADNLGGKQGLDRRRFFRHNTKTRNALDKHGTPPVPAWPNNALVGGWFRVGCAFRFGFLEGRAWFDVCWRFRSFYGRFFAGLRLARV